MSNRIDSETIISILGRMHGQGSIYTVLFLTSQNQSKTINGLEKQGPFTRSFSIINRLIYQIQQERGRERDSVCARRSEREACDFEFYSASKVLSFPNDLLFILLISRFMFSWFCLCKIFMVWCYNYCWILIRFSSMFYVLICDTC